MATLQQLARLQRDILEGAGIDLAGRKRVLDLGCGNGTLVQAWLDSGHDARGCDFQFKPGPLVDALGAQDRIRLVGREPYTLPFPDVSFDILLTNQVMEHVKDYPGTIAEMRRVLKPGGVCLHMFPSRWRPIEPHVAIPFGTVLQNGFWLSIWALLGVRRPRQKGMSWRDTVQDNVRYLSMFTNYLTGEEIRHHFAQYFAEVRFEEELFLRHSPNARGRLLHSVGRCLPMVYGLYRTAWSRTILAR